MPKLGVSYAREAPQPTPLYEFIRGYRQIQRGYRTVERARRGMLTEQESGRIVGINQMLEGKNMLASRLASRLIFEGGKTSDPAKLTQYERGEMAAIAMKSLKDAVQRATGTGTPPIDTDFDYAKRILEKLGIYTTSNRVGTLVLKRLKNYLEGGYMGNNPRIRDEIDEFANFAGIPRKTVDEVVASIDKKHKKS